MPSNERQIIIIQETARKTIVNINNVKKEFKTAFLNKLNFKDAINYIKDSIYNKY